MGETPSSMDSSVSTRDEQGALSWTERDRATVWHGFTQMDAYTSASPLVVERATGRYLVDVEGRSYFDGISSLWVNTLGHRVPELDSAIRRQLDRIAHSTMLGNGNRVVIELSEALAGVIPVDGPHLLFASDGASAVEQALKIAFQYWANSGRPGRTEYLTLGGAYHGDTVGSLSLGDGGFGTDLFDPLRFTVVRTPGYDDPGWLEKALVALEHHGDKLAAVVIEPVVQGASGMLVADPQDVGTFGRACANAGVLFVADEVATGFGRTTKMFASDWTGLSPDIMCLGKGITGGYLPMSVTAASERVFDAFLGAGSERARFLPRALIRWQRTCGERRARAPATVRAVERARAGDGRCRAARAHPRTRRGATSRGVRGPQVRPDGGCRARLSGTRGSLGQASLRGGNQARRAPPTARRRGRLYAAAHIDRGRASEHGRGTGDRSRRGGAMTVGREDTWRQHVERECQTLEETGSWRRPRSFDPAGASDSSGSLEGGDRRVVAFASNDYLGLSTHPAVLRAAHGALDRWGTGAGASRLVTGSRPVHHELEAELARWKRQERATLFPTGFAANLGVLATFGHTDALICSDELNHASIVDGARLARAEVAVFAHGDIEHLEALLAAERPSAGDRRNGSCLLDGRRHCSDRRNRGVVPAPRCAPSDRRGPCGAGSRSRASARRGDGASCGDPVQVARIYRRVRGGAEAVHRVDGEPGPFVHLHHRPAARRRRGRARSAQDRAIRRRVRRSWPGSARMWTPSRQVIRAR